MGIENRIAFIIVYMGEWPWYFPYFLHTCKYNPTITFFLFSDNVFPATMPSNVKGISYTLHQFNIDASKVLDFEVNVKHGYKLCDFKPAFGYIFANIIKSYDFWGYCDIDIIWGNIRNFITPDLLNSYDIISARHDYLTGCFALYRNNLKMRELFKESKDYRKVFINPQNYFFDETNFAFEAFEKRWHYSKIETEIESMTHLVRKLQENEEIRAYFEFQIVEGTPGNITWDKGTLVYLEEFEAMFYHLVRFKNIYEENYDEDKTIPDNFCIKSDRIFF